MSKEHAYYINGLYNFNSVCYFDEIDNIEVYYRIEVDNKTIFKSRVISFTNKFIEGTLLPQDIELIINQFNENAARESDIYYFSIDKEDHLTQHIETTRTKIKEYLEQIHCYDWDEDSKYQIIATNEDIENELKKYYYIKIGEYYLYGINIEESFRKCLRISV